MVFVGTSFSIYFLYLFLSFPLNSSQNTHSFSPFTSPFVSVFKIKFLSSCTFLSSVGIFRLLVCFLSFWTTFSYSFPLLSPKGSFFVFFFSFSRITKKIMNRLLCFVSFILSFFTRGMSYPNVDAIKFPWRSGYYFFIG